MASTSCRRGLAGRHDVRAVRRAEVDDGPRPVRWRHELGMAPGHAGITVEGDLRVQLAALAGPPDQCRRGGQGDRRRRGGRARMLGELTLELDTTRSTSTTTTHPGRTGAGRRFLRRDGPGRLRRRRSLAGGEVVPAALAEQRSGFVRRPAVRAVDGRRRRPQPEPDRELLLRVLESAPRRVRAPHVSHHSGSSDWCPFGQSVVMGASSPMRVTERQRGSDYLRPAWPGNAIW